MKTFMSSKEALQASRKSKKDLIILRTEFSTVRFSREKNYPTPEMYVGDLLKTQKVQNELKDDFVFLFYDQKESNMDDQLFVKLKYFYDYSPNLIILSPKAQTIAYVKLNIYDLTFDIVEMIHDSIKKFEKDANHLRALEGKYEAKSISPTELTDLIKLRSNLCLRSREYWNYFSTLNAKLPTDLEFSWNTFCKEDFSIQDEFFQFLLKCDKPYGDIKLQMINNLKDLRYSENDIESYQYLSALSDSLTKAMFTQDDDLSSFFGNTIPMWETGNQESNAMELIELYKKANNDSMLVSTSEKYVESILTEYDDRKTKRINAHEEMLNMLKDALISNLPPSDTVFSWEEFKATSINNEVKLMNKQYSDDFNQIAWAYFESIDDIDDLQRAISWCQKSIEFNPAKENNDTMAHLYYKIGDRDNAISYQTKALTIAEKQSLSPEQLKYYSEELEKFKAK